jgi:cytochrome P450
MLCEFKEVQTTSLAFPLYLFLNNILSIFLTWWLVSLFDLGPIVRIGPNELHIKDSEYYNALYNMTNKLDKSAWFYGMLGNPTATFPTIRADVHKVRRNAIGPFFSTQSVMKFRPQVQALADRLTVRMKGCAERDEPIPVFFAYRCLTVDIISEYLFGKQMDLLDREDWGRSFYSSWRGLWEMSPLIRQLPWMMDVFRVTPRWLLALTQPKALEVLSMEDTTGELTRQVLASDSEAKKTDRTSMVWEIAHSDSLPPDEKTFKRLAVEANNILAAGFETTGGTLTHLTYNILADPEVHKKLQKELEVAIPDEDIIPNYQTLEKLPYLNAVMKETLRYNVYLTSVHMAC